MVKRLVKRRPKKRMGRRMKKSKWTKKRNVLVMKVPRSMGDFPLPPRMRCRFLCKALLTKPGATSKGEQYVFSGNSLYQPFNGVRITSLGIPNGNGGLTLVGGTPSLTAMQPYGFSNLCSPNGPYLSYRVLASSISIKITPQALGDLLTVSTCPVQPFDPPTNIDICMHAPWAKTKVVTTGESGQQESVNNYLTAANAIGVAKSVWLNNPNYAAVYNNAPVSEWFHYVIWATNDNANAAQPIGISISVTYYAELFNILEGDLLQT